MIGLMIAIVIGGLAIAAVEIFGGDFGVWLSHHVSHEYASCALLNGPGIMADIMAWTLLGCIAVLGVGWVLQRVWPKKEARK